MSKEKASPRQWESVIDYISFHVKDPQRHKQITKILFAVNGNVAVRGILLMRKVLDEIFKNERIVKIVCACTEKDLEKNPEYGNLCDEWAIAPDGFDYSDIDELIAMAVRKEVNAVWTGGTGASQNPLLPQRLAEIGIAWLGPPQSTLLCINDQIASLIIAQAAKVPTPPWSGSGIVLDEVDCRNNEGVISVSEKQYANACVSDLNEGLTALRMHQIRYPLMISAYSESGKRSVRKVQHEKNFARMFAAVREEAPTTPVFILSSVEHARYGNVVPAYTVDSSTQRCGYAVIEETPASVAPPSVMQAMQEDAVRLAKFVGYQSAGTAEFLYLPKTNKYYFNKLTSLQCDFPGQEPFCKLNIPGIELLVGMGIPLNHVECIRQFYDLKQRKLQLEEGRGVSDQRVEALRRFVGSSRFSGTKFNVYTPLPAQLVKPASDNHCLILYVHPSHGPNGPSQRSMRTLAFNVSTKYGGLCSKGGTATEHGSQNGIVFVLGANRDECLSRLPHVLQELVDEKYFTGEVLNLIRVVASLPAFVNNTHTINWLHHMQEIIDITEGEDSLTLSTTADDEPKIVKWVPPSEGCPTRVECIDLTADEMKCNNPTAGDMQKEESVSHVEAQDGDHSMKRAESRKRDHEHETAEEPQEKK